MNRGDKIFNRLSKIIIKTSFITFMFHPKHFLRKIKGTYF